MTPLWISDGPGSIQSGVKPPHSKVIAMADNQSQPEQLGPVMDEFVARYRRGERPSVTEYAERHPDLADQIRELFPALVLMERAGSGDDGAPGGAVTADGKTLERLGEYRIVREIGRGGMGIVYEAEQESLGRRVAIKVLPFHALMTPKHLKRFQIEARAAAQLHHSNIVPVFAVGVDQGVHYYAMQYIQGLGLDEVLVELKRLRRQHRPEPIQGADQGTPNESLSASVASILVSGAPQRASQSEQGECSTDQARASSRPAGDRQLAPGHTASGNPQLTHRVPDAASPTSHTARGDSSARDDSSASLILPGDTAPTSSATSDLHYFRSVARVGVQVADALAYAHGQGVLHRDVKPSNLLLDMKGCVRVTDFGLAKTTPLTPSSEGGDAADHLTHTGDFVGTLRYMAPERFRGWSDSRSDVYSLGLTLYEMLTLGPAFDGNDRARLVRQITHQDPPRPRRVDPHVPRDLETIVLKATAKEPHARYESAADMRDDLRRFLDDKPIVARRTSLSERVRMWCRRNPLVAGLTAAVALLLITLAIGSSVAALRLKEKHKAALDSLTRVRTAEGKERDAHNLATRRLFDAYLEQARAGRWSGRAGRRFESLDAIRKAAALMPALDVDEASRRALRDEAIGCLALIDLRDERRGPDDAPAESGLRYTAFDRQIERFARLDSAGEIVVRRITDDAETCRLPGKWTERHTPPYVLFSPDDRLVAACGETADAEWRVKLWKLDGRSILLEAPYTARVAEHPLAFSADSRHLAVKEAATQLAIFDTETGQLAKRVTCPIGNSVAFSPDGERLVTNAGSKGSDVVIVDWHTAAIERTLPHPMAVGHVAFSRDGRLIAAACNDKNVYVWDTRQLDEPWTVCRGHLSQAIFVAFNHDGSLLMSTSYDGTTRLWDPRRGEQLVSSSHRGLGFSSDNRWLAFNDLTAGYGRCAVFDASECRVLSTSPPLDHVVDVAFSPDGRLFAAVSRSGGVDVWETASGAEVARFNVGVETRSVEFTPDRRHLIASGRASVDRWPIEAITSGDAKNLFTQRENIAQSNFPCETAVSRDGRRMAASLGGGAVNVYDLANLQAVQRMKPAPSTSWFVAISPTGQWVAASHKSNADLPVWDATTGELVQCLHTTDELPGALVAFSPDNRWLVVSEFGQFVFYETGTWPIDEALRTNSNDIALNERRASLLYNSPRTDDAIEAYSRLIELKPGQVDPRYYRAVLLTRAERHAEAIADYEFVLQSDPNSALVANNLAWIYATAPAGVRSPQKALPLALQAVERQPNDMYALNTLGVVYYRLGDYSKAIDALLAAAKANPDGATGFDHFFLAMSHHRVGNAAKAHEHFDKALDWWRRQQDLPRDWPEELKQFCLEAAALLGTDAPQNAPGR